MSVVGVHAEGGEARMMGNVRLGATGLKVSRICLGTATFGLQADEEESIGILNRAAEAGVTFLDTANRYPLGAPEIAGRTEEIVGRWLRGRRDNFVVATKCVGWVGERPFHGGASRRHIFDAIDASLRRLGTEYIDLYQLHRPDPETPIDETLGALDDLVRSGKVRYIGCCNFLAYQLARALGRSEALGLARFISVQPRYNLLFREFERELFPLCQEEGIAVTPFNPIAAGMLSGKHDRRAEPQSGGRFALNEDTSHLYRGRYWHDRAFDAVDAIRDVAEEASLQLPTLAVAWVLAQPAVTCPIIGASRADQLEATLAAADVRLDETLLEKLDTLTRAFRLGDATF